MAVLPSVKAKMDLRIALSPVLLSCRNMHIATLPPATVHVTGAGTTIPAHRSAAATMPFQKTPQVVLNICSTT
jgi:hypothetical protein